MADERIAIAIDLGGTKAIIGIVTEKGEVLESQRLKLEDPHAPENLVTRFAEIAETVRNNTGIDKNRIAGLGVGFAGLVNRKTGIVELAPNIGWRNVPLAEMISRATGYRTVVENDVNAGAVGEWLFGAAKGARNVVAIMVGTGIGGGFILDGKLYTGGEGLAAEIGHMIFRNGGDICGCGKLGHFESYAGGFQMQERFRRAVDEGRTTSALLMADGDVKAVHAGHIFAAAEEGDPLCAGLWKDAELALSTLATNLAVILDPDVLVLGGGVVDRIPVLVERVEEFLRQNATEGVAGRVKVVRAGLIANAVLIGAAAVALRLAG